MVEWKKLGELGKFENIGTDKKIVDGEVLVTLLNYVDVYHHKYIDSSVPQMQVSASDKKIVDCTVEQGDIFVTPSSETVDDIGHSAVITETIHNAVYSYHIMRYRLFEKNMLLSYYINYSFDTDNVKKQILKKAQGLTRFGLSKDKFASIFIPIPSLEEQTRIVGILDTFTSAIDNLKEQIAQRRKQYEYYRCRLFSTENWTEIKIGKLTKVFSCPRVFKDQWQDSGVPFWRSSDIMSYHNGVINPRGEVFISQSLYNELSSKSDKIKEGDILVTGGGSIGIPYLKKDNSPLFVKDADLICIQKCSSIIPKYLYHYFLSTDFKMYLKIITHDATIAHYTINQIKDTPIPLPSLPEQQRIVSILDTFESSIQNLEAQLKERQKQYEYYRNKLLTFE